MKRTVSTALVLVPALASTLVFTLVPPLDAAAWSWLFGLGLGLVVGAALVLYLRLRRSLGTVTAVPALALVSGLVLGGLSWAVPACPGTTLDVRCPAALVGQWTLSGMLLPVVVGLTLLPLLVGWRSLRLGIDLRAGRKEVPLLGHLSRWSGLATGPGRSKGASIEPKRALTQEARPRRKGPRPDRSGPKGTPTPRRPKS